jgi:hypothetical protein
MCSIKTRLINSIPYYMLYAFCYGVLLEVGTFDGN